jgi:hypothetical protein
MVPRVLDEETNDGAIGTGKRYVDFSTGGAYWMVDGGYSVEWYKLEKPYANDDAFIEETKHVLPTLGAKPMGDSFKPLSTDVLQVNGRAAVRVVAECVHDKIDTYWVATSIDFGDRVAVSLLLIPKKTPKDNRPASGDEAAAWGDYPAFTQSITRH